MILFNLGNHFTESTFKQFFYERVKFKPDFDTALEIIKNSEIKFKNVDFAYDIKESITISSVNLEFKGGKMTSLVGHSGSGKSTIMNLIPRFYDCQSGDITIDGQSVYGMTIKSLRNEISMVSQETTLFDDTIKNNIGFGLDSSEIDKNLINKSL